MEAKPVSHCITLTDDQRATLLRFYRGPFPAQLRLRWQQYHLDVSRETVRQWLRRADIVWRRPRPVLRRRDPRRTEILGELRQLLLTLPADETAVFEDEVDINLNPKIGCMWMRKGQ